MNVGRPFYIVRMIADRIYQILHADRDKDKAEAMSRYMKNKFHFFGIQSPVRKNLLKSIYKETKQLTEEDLWQLTFDLWSYDQRECQYAAMDIWSHNIKRLNWQALSNVEYLITKKSWWDTVDWLAVHMAGRILKNAIDKQVTEKINEWLESDHLWLQRTTLIHQLSYKTDTNTALLNQCISTLEGDQEFFIQKAIGWALRQYSKTNPDWVREYITDRPMSTIAMREAKKYI